MRDAAIVNSIDRLRGLARESINGTARPNLRLTQLQVAATDSNVARVLTDSVVSAAEMRAAVRSVRGMLAAAADTVNFLRLDFWRADGRRRGGSAAAVAERDSTQLPPLVA